MNQDLLSQLRDIHAAPDAPWWPPAPGWWILAVLLLLLIAIIVRFALARYRLRQRRKQMLGWVDGLNEMVDPAKEPQAYLAMLNRIFKLVAIKAFPEQKCASMSGGDWARFMMNQMADETSSDALEILATGPYDPAPVFDADVISALSRKWIKKHG